MFEDSLIDFVPDGPKVDLIKAAQYFAQAISKGFQLLLFLFRDLIFYKDHILGIYHLAEMNFYALNMPHNCEMANRVIHQICVAILCA